MDIWILDDSIRIRIFFDREDCIYEDNICVSFRESCPADEKIFRADETNIFLTTTQAIRLSQALKEAAEKSVQDDEL
ncbi:MAG: hypothetical protein MUO76_23180 [Anaerolineaceae bacterium]|nr:hypothetical protein [Anaerolineaceae bacterium]